MRVRHAVAMLAIPAGVLGVSATAAFAVPGASSAPPSPEVVGTSGAQPSVQAVGVTASPSSSLPVTGGDIAGMTIIGVALVGGGVVLVRRTRTRASD